MAYPERNRAFRPTPADLAAARERTVPDVLPAPGGPAYVLFCGINPGLYTAATGWHFGRPGNRFWPALHASGFTDRLLHPSEQGELARLGHGITNLVTRPTARADELAREELRAAPERLAALLTAVRPRVLAVLGVSAYRIAFADPTAAIGPQPAPGGPGSATTGPAGAALWVLPNPSGLNAHYPLPRLAEEFARVRQAAGAPPGG